MKKEKIKTGYLLYIRDERNIQENLDYGYLKTGS